MNLSGPFEREGYRRARDLLALDTTLDARRRAIFLSVFWLLCHEGERQGPVYVETVLQYPPTETHRLAERTKTSCPNIRMAKMRSRRYMRQNAGSWVDEVAQRIRDAQRDQLDREEAI